MVQLLYIIINLYFFNIKLPLYDSLEWNGKETPYYEEEQVSCKKSLMISDKSIENEEQIKATYTNASTYGIIPKIFGVEENCLMFSQKFYSQKSKFNIKEECKIDIDKIASKIPKSPEYLPVMNSLDMTQVLEDSNYRLACIAYDLNSEYVDYTIKMPPNTYGRYITILGLDVVKSVDEDNNFDIGPLTFNGFEIPSCLSLSKE